MPSSVICLLTEEWRRARRHTEVSALPCVSFLPVYLLKSDMLLRASLRMPSIQWEDGRELHRKQVWLARTRLGSHLHTKLATHNKCQTISSSVR